MNLQIAFGIRHLSFENGRSMNLRTGRMAIKKSWLTESKEYHCKGSNLADAVKQSGVIPVTRSQD
jgi:hypothetical protein